MTCMWSPTGPDRPRRYAGQVPPHPLSAAVVRALDGLVDEGAVPWQGAPPDAEEADDARVSRDAVPYATSLALRVAGRAGIAAADLAGLLVARLREDRVVGSARVSGPGYVEIEPDPAALLRAAMTTGWPATPATNGSGSNGSGWSHGALDPLGGGEPGAELRRAVHDVGADAVRFALARRTADRAPLDLEVLGRADERNPVYAVQLAHARLAGVLRHADASGLAPAGADEVAPDLLGEPPAQALAAAVAEAGPTAARAVRLRRPDLLVRHLSATAEAALDYLSSCPPLPTGDEVPDRRHRARLRLALAAGDALAHGLDLLGVTAPERM
jgi:arginyl-tRNA synthetase